MKWLLLASAGVALTGCSSNSGSDIVSEQFIHKYGFNVSENEWKERAEEGRVVTQMKNGVKIVRSFENGELHGLTTYTFPNSELIERLLTFDQGTLLKEVVQDPRGIPVSEEIYEFDDRKILTYWDEKGAPLSIEEYDGENLQEGKYYTPEHDLEAHVDAGFGERVKRDRTGLLLSRDTVENGNAVKRTTFHPNGRVHTVSRYSDYQLHGEQLKFTASGLPMMTVEWDHGVLDGVKTVYRNGNKLADIPYIHGQKHGIERHYDDLGRLTAEILWKNDKKHGPSYFHSEESTDAEWFFKGQAVGAQKFETLEARDKIIAETSIQ